MQKKLPVDGDNLVMRKIHFNQSSQPSAHGCAQIKSNLASPRGNERIKTCAIYTRFYIAVNNSSDENINQDGSKKRYYLLRDQLIYYANNKFNKITTDKNILKELHLFFEGQNSLEELSNEQLDKIKFLTDHTITKQLPFYSIDSFSKDNSDVIVDANNFADKFQTFHHGDYLGLSCDWESELGWHGFSVERRVN